MTTKKTGFSAKSISAPSQIAISLPEYFRRVRLRNCVHAITFNFCVALLVGCLLMMGTIWLDRSGYPSKEDAFDRVVLGMSVEEVIGLLGPPPDGFTTRRVDGRFHRQPGPFVLTEGVWYINHYYPGMQVAH